MSPKELIQFIGLTVQPKMVTVEFVKATELRRWLKKQGCSFVEESRHTRIILGSKVSRMPRHPAKEIKTGTLQSILNDLDLKM